MDRTIPPGSRSIESDAAITTAENVSVESKDLDLIDEFQEAVQASNTDNTPAYGTTGVAIIRDFNVARTPGNMVQDYAFELTFYVRPSDRKETFRALYDVYHPDEIVDAIFAYTGVSDGDPKKLYGKEIPVMYVETEYETGEWQMKLPTTTSFTSRLSFAISNLLGSSSWGSQTQAFERTYGLPNPNKPLFEPSYTDPSPDGSFIKTDDDNLLSVEAILHAD